MPSKNPLQDNGGECGGHPDAGFPSEHEGPHELADTRRKQVVGHETDHRGGKQVLHADTSQRPEEHAPADAPDPESDEIRGNGRNQPDVTGFRKSPAHVPQVRFAKGQPEKQAADQDAGP